MVSTLLTLGKRYALILGGGSLVLTSIAVILPRIFDFIEFRFDATLPYEAVVRLTLLAVYAAFLAGGLWWIFVRGQRKHLLVWCTMAVSCIAFVVVVFGDRGHRLMEEFSWIRYTTGFFLLVASVAALLLRRGTLSWLLGVGFFYAALDEVLELHEKLGGALGAFMPVPPNATDYITIIYALVGLIGVLLVVRYARQWVRDVPFAVQVLLAGVATYALSTVFDTIDFWVLERLRLLGAFWVAHVGSYFTDVTYIFWAPRNFLNGLEELLEQMAAALFFAAMIAAVFGRRSREWMERPVAVKKYNKLFTVSCALFTIVVMVMVLLGGHASVPVIPNGQATIIASAPQGLFHADDIFYHPAWGVIVANEGRGTIFQWRDGVWRQIPDPEHLIQNPDSVTADDRHLYIADSAQGIIFVYPLDPGSAPMAIGAVRDDKRGADGLSHPEALIVVKGTLFVLDEGEKTITKLMQDASTESWRPDHAQWIAPESIAYDAVRDKLYVSDDESGAIFTVDFEKRMVSEIATLPRPEDITVLPNGSLLATDTRAGAIFHVYPEDGRAEKIAQFKRPYRDLQGIAYDGEQLFVISADGFGSNSFMPSFLWQLWIPFA